MTCRGRVQNGVVVLEGGAALPDGTEVIVSTCRAGVGSAAEETVRDAMLRLADWVESQPCSLPEDLAANHDHYLHGLTKRR